MDRVSLLLVAFPLLVFASDVYTLFLSPPHHHHPPPPPHHQPPGVPHLNPKDNIVDPRIPPPSKVFTKPGAVDPTSLGRKFHISFCSSCSYKKNAIEMRNFLMNSFGTEVILSNYPPPIHKRMLIKLLPIVQFGGIAMVVAGEHIFPRLGYASPPMWYNYLRQNRFGAAAGFWILGNVLQNTLQSTGAFEVYFDGDLIFSKLREGRFPSEFELRELVGRTVELKLK